MYEGQKIHSTIGGRNLIFVLQEKPHQIYHRNGADLMIELDLDLSEVCFIFHLLFYYFSYYIIYFIYRQFLVLIEK